MTIRSLVTAALAAAFGATAVPAAAVTCYIVLDRSDNVVYRSTVPPVDLSDRGAPARERMRERGEYLMFGEFEMCPGVTFFTGAGGSKELALDQIVNGMPALPTAGQVAPGRAPGGAAAAPAAPPRAPASSGGRSTSSY